MQVYFWFAELDNHEDNPFCHSNSGIVVSNGASEAFYQASAAAREGLGPKGSFTIKQFNKVS